MADYFDIAFSVTSQELDYIEKNKTFFFDGLDVLGFPFDEGSIVKFCQDDIEAPFRTMLCRVDKIREQLFAGDTTLILYLERIDEQFSLAVG